MPNKLFDLLRKAFSKPKEKQKYLVVVREKCAFMQDELGLVCIVESFKKVKAGMQHAYPCGGLDRDMSAEEQTVCKKCNYKRVRIIDAVDSYSYKKAQTLRAEPGTKTLKDIL